MNWLMRLLTPGLRGDNAPSVHAIQFDTIGWIPTKSWRRLSRSSLEWCDANGDTLCVRVHGKPAGHLVNLPDLMSLRSFYRQDAARHGGGIVSVETVRVGNILSAKVINKYERLPAYAYDGTLAIPLKNAHCTITMRSIESGVTGRRDALVTAHLAERGELEIEKAEKADQPGSIKGWFQDPYDASYQGRTLYSMSDDERLDALFLDHPLSRIRSRLTQIQNTFAIDAAHVADSPQESSTRESERIERARDLLSTDTVVTLYPQCRNV